MKSVVAVPGSIPGMIALRIMTGVHKPTEVRVSAAEGFDKIIVDSPFGVWIMQTQDAADVADALITTAGHLRRLT